MKEETKLKNDEYRIEITGLRAKHCMQLTIVWLLAALAVAVLTIWDLLVRVPILPFVVAVGLTACGSSPPPPSACVELEATVQAGAAASGDSTCLDVVSIEWGYIKNEVCAGRPDPWACNHLGVAIEDAILCAESMPALYAYLDVYDAWQVLRDRPECQDE
jgi:hypothetical protein